MAARSTSTRASARWTAAALIAIGWCAALLWLLLADSNPVTLNRQQILDADVVVTTRISDPSSGTCRIVEQWRGAPVPEQFVVKGLSETAATADSDWILPLAATAKGFEVVPSRLPSHARLVYPATPEAIDQLEEILSPRTNK